MKLRIHSEASAMITVQSSVLTSLRERLRSAGRLFIDLFSRTRVSRCIKYVEHATAGT